MRISCPKILISNGRNGRGRGYYPSKRQRDSQSPGRHPKLHSQAQPKLQTIRLDKPADLFLAKLNRLPVTSECFSALAFVLPSIDQESAGF
jgi:hypothetical protein